MEISATLATSSRTVSKNFRRGAVQKPGLRVDLGKCYALRILLQKLASTQPRTSPGKIANFREIFGKFSEISATLATSSRTVAKNFRRGAVQKLGVRGDLGKCYTLRILLQNMASIQPRTSPCIFKIFEIFQKFSKILNFQKFSKIFKNFQNFRKFSKSLDAERCKSWGSG